MKTQPETLVDEIADDFNTYLRKGVRVGEIASSADPNLNIDDLEKVLRIHFVLTGSLEEDEQDEDDEVGVIDFVNDLRDEVRRIKTTVTKDTEFLENEVRGRIDWQQTIKERYRSASPNVGYACTQTRENYNIDENLVLKRLLAVIHETVFEDLKPALENPEDYEWFKPWVAPEGENEEDLKEVVDDVFRDNIYLQRIEMKDRQITDRTIESVKKSRSSLYRNAAELLDRYRRLTRQDIDEEEAKEVLQNTFVRPSENERLFELYWVFKILDRWDNPRFKLIDEDYEGLVAQWEEGGYEYKMFHNSIGSDSLTFSEEVDIEDAPDEDGYLSRLVRVNKEFERLQGVLLDRDSQKGLWGGLPDILIERWDSKGELDQVFIGEVKYTRDKGYAAQGLKELLEYMAFVKEGGDYVEEESRLFDCENVHGALFVDSVERIESDDEDVRVVEFGENPA